MKKSTFYTLLIGVVGGSLFSIGLCMCLLPEWNAFQEGVIITAMGLVVLLGLGVFRWVKSGKKMKKINWKTVGKVAYGVVSTLVFGAGMCLVLVMEQMLLGIALGIGGIVMLLYLIPMCIGFKK